MHDPASRRRVLKNIAAIWRRRDSFHRIRKRGTASSAFRSSAKRRSSAAIRPDSFRRTATNSVADRARYVAECRQGPDGPFAISGERNSSIERPTTA